MTDGNRTSPNQRWISFVNASGEVIPPYAIVWVKPLTDAWENIDNADRLEAALKWKAYKPLFPSLEEAMADPSGVEYPSLLAINSSSEVAIDGTGLLTFATDGPAWVSLYPGTGSPPSDTSRNAKLGQGHCIGPSGDGWHGTVQGIGFRTVRPPDFSNNRHRVLVMADPGPYEMELVSPGVYGGTTFLQRDGGTQEYEAPAIDTEEYGPLPIGVCIPLGYSPSSSYYLPPPGDDNYEVPYYPVDFNRQGMLFSANIGSTEGACRLSFVLASPMSKFGLWTPRSNTRMTAIGGNGTNIFAQVGVQEAIGESGPKVARVQLACNSDYKYTTILAQPPNCRDGNVIEEGLLLDVTWNGCVGQIMGYYLDCQD